MRGLFGAILRKSGNDVHKTVPLAPTVRRSIASPVRVPGLEFVTTDSGPNECEHCYGLGLIPVANIDYWCSCFWCKKSNLHVFVCRVGDLFLAVRDSDNSIGWGENVVDALLQCESNINEGDSIWSKKYTADTKQENPISIKIQRRTHALLEKQALLQGCSLDEILARLAIGNTDKFIDNSDNAVNKKVYNTLEKEHPSGNPTSRVNTG